MGLAFFVLAYVELFSGGANLPGGPITPFTGAADNVWTPQWPLIGVYAYHGLLLSWLLSLTLIAFDGLKIPQKLLFFGILLSLFAVVLGRPHMEALGILAFGAVALLHNARKV